VQLGRRGIASAPGALALALGSHALGAAPAGLAAAISQTALAGAASGAGALAFTFMSITKLQGGVAAVVLALAGGLWFFQHLQLARTQAENTEILAHISRLTAEAQAAGRQTSAWRAEPNGGAGSATPSETPPPPSAEMLARNRATLDHDYAGLFRRLQLDALRLEQLRDRLAERAARSMHVRSQVVRVAGQWMDEWANKTEELDYIAAGAADIDAQIRELLGNEKYALFANYERTLPWRTAFNELAVMLQPVDPLSEEQIDQLTSWAAAADPNFFTDRAKSGPRIPAEVAERAKGLLRPTQWEKLIVAQAASEAYRQMMVAAAAARLRATNPATATPRP
jgi:hypothetical protein